MVQTEQIAQFPTSDIERAREFLQQLDPDTDVFTFQTFSDSAEKRKSYTKNPITNAIIDPLARTFHGTIDQHFATLADMSRKGAGVFVTINKTDFKGRKSENIVGARAYFVDSDEVPWIDGERLFSALGKEPHIVVSTSGDKWHAYWCIDDIPLESWLETQKKLTEVFGSDPQVNKLPQVMRLPGFTHQKDGSGREIVEMTFKLNEPNYSNEEFREALDRALAIKRRDHKEARGSVVAAASGGLKKTVNPLQGYPDGQRTNALERLAGSCFGRGMSLGDAIEFCRGWNALNRPPLDDEKIVATVTSIQNTDKRNHSEKYGQSSPVEQIGPLKIIRGDELLSEPVSPRRWLLDPFFPLPEVTLFGADGGGGKTTLALQLSIACVTGGSWLGYKAQLCNVLYVSAEDASGEIHYRLEQIRKHISIPTEALARFKLVDLAGVDAEIITFDPQGKMTLTDLFGKLAQAAQEHSAGLIVLDATADVFGGGESERKEVRAFLRQMRGLALRLDVAVVLLSHPSVDGIKTGRGYSGSTHWNNGVRSRLYLRSAESGGDNGISELDAKIIELAKSNRTRPGQTIKIIWNDGMFVEFREGAVENSASHALADETFLRLLAKVESEGLEVGPHKQGSNFAPALFAKRPGGRELGKATLERTMARLLDKEVIHVRTEGPPSKRRQRLAAGKRPG